jgi:hypothetical protein
VSNEKERRSVTVYLPARPGLRTNPEAAKRLAEILRRLRTTDDVIDIADAVADAAASGDMQKEVILEANRGLLSKR